MDELVVWMLVIVLLMWLNKRRAGEPPTQPRGNAVFAMFIALWLIAYVLSQRA